MQPPSRHDLVGSSVAMREVLEAADDVASTPTTVLLMGESGTGKEVLARHIHAQSPRAKGPWVAVNCAALPSELLESELFGHERGAFTGASERRCGRIEQAHGGTLLLDEISELPLQLQAKLLRVIQERELDRVGGARTVPVDVRIIATSNRDLATMVAAKAFRADLYYRLNVFPIQLPPLRQRRDDIVSLAQHLLHLAALSMERTPPPLTEQACAVLKAYSFPGNVRELGNLMERALVRCRDEVLDVQHLGLTLNDTLKVSEPEEPVVAGPFPHALPLNLDELERLAITEALRRVNGNRTHAARILGIGLRTLRNKLHAFKEGKSVQEELAGGQLPPSGNAFLTAFSTEYQTSVAARSSQDESV